MRLYATAVRVAHTRAARQLARVESAAGPSSVARVCVRAFRSLVVDGHCGGRSLVLPVAELERALARESASGGGGDGDDQDGDTGPPSLDRAIG